MGSFGLSILLFSMLFVGQIAEVKGEVISEEVVATESVASTAMEPRMMIPGGDVTVNTVEDLVDTIQGVEMDKTIHLGDSFPRVLTARIAIEYNKPFKITIDGEQADGNPIELKTALGDRHFFINNIIGSGSITLKSLILTGLREIDSSGNVIV